jgi:putative flavoprotein involved in K+ transport
MAQVHDVIIIGAGQAGLAAAHEVQKRTCNFVVLEASARLGSSWRERYDSLVLFTPAEYDSLPGLPLALPKGVLPTKDQIADYFERYAAYFGFPIQLGERVRSLTKDGDVFTITTNSAHYWAKSVIVASGAFQRPHVPSYNGQAGATLEQLHSAAYKNSAQLAPGAVLVVGAGNSAAQIAEELSRDRVVSLSVRGALRFRPLRVFGKSVFFWADILGLLHAERDSRSARRLRRAGDPIFGGALRQRIAQGAVRVRPEIARIASDRVFFRDGSSQQFAAIVWATGYRHAYPWLHIPGALDATGAPLHERGMSPVPGLSYLGLPWQRARSSALLLGAARDAAWLVTRVLGPERRSSPASHEQARGSHEQALLAPLLSRAHQEPLARSRIALQPRVRLGGRP